MIHVQVTIFQEHSSRYVKPIVGCTFFVLTQLKKKIRVKSLALYAGLFYNAYTIIFAIRKLLFTYRVESNTKMLLSVNERKIMTYYQFVQTVEENIKRKVTERTHVSVYHTAKNNGVDRKGLLMEDKGLNIAPTIYLEEYYSRFLRGESLENITGEILLLYEKLRFRKPWKADVLCHYESVRDKIVYRLVGRKKNQELLSRVPYVEYLDLAIVFYVLLENNEQGTASMMICNHHLDMWNVDVEEVYERAKNNTWQLLRSEFMNMGSVLEELTGIQDTYVKDDLYVLSNHLRSFGAAVILYPGKLTQIGFTLKEDFFVIPSSVHETLILPVSTNMSRGNLKEIVLDINETQVPDEEVLSDEVYLFKCDENRLIL